MVNKLIEQGLRQHRAGRLEDAKNMYNQILVIDPWHPEALHLLGLTTLQSGDPAQAAELIRKAVRLQPKNWTFHANLAMALFELGDLNGALATFRHAAKLNPQEPQVQMGIANCLARQGELPQAEAQLRKLVRRFPRFALAWFNLGNVARDQGRVEEAVDVYRRAIQLDSALVDAHNNLGNTLQAQGRLEEAEQAYRQALQLAPTNVMAWCNLASVLIDRGRFAAAEAACRQAIATDPASAAAHTILGSAIGHQGRLHEALELHRKAAAFNPNDARTLIALGSALYEIGLPAEGLPILERGVSMAPHSWQAHFSLATVKLALGEFHEGWREFLYRSARERFVRLNPDVALVSTLPGALTGQCVCLLHEQGLGDQFFFLRFAARLKARGARITYRSTPKIASILKRVALVDHVIPDTEPIPQADHTLLVGDLPGALSTTAARPDLLPPLPLIPLADQLAMIESRLARLGPPPYFGLTWRGGVAPEEQRGMAWMLFKQAPLEQFGEALRGLNATFVALQRNPEPGEIEQLCAHLGRPVHDLTALNEDLEAMLALLALIDDYVGVSNTNMHLRAGVGRTARVLVPCPAEWRWMATGDESPWFAGFRVYRQQPSGSWDDAFERLRDDLFAQFGRSARTDS